uniref:Metallophos domain-containing protein n=1 Tax=Rhabditophanes sp. KR3021 TaxID=114890 RepID=A0AC35UGJ1_9BILA
MIIHLGDLAYDLHSEDGNVGDTFMDEMEPLIATKPYMVIAGNHEFDWRATNFANYEKRFNMPLDGDQKNQYYSFNAGPISFVGISSEFYGFFYDFGIQPVLDQYSYLEKKFQSINADRGDHPWLITFHHRPFYCSNADSTECDAFENRAGCHSFISKVGKLSPFSAKTVSDYGYAIMHVKSKNELYIEQISSSAGYENRQVVDSYTMSKDPNYILGQSELKPEQYTDFAIEYKEVPKFIRSICVGRDIRCRDIFQKVSAMKYKKYYVEDNTYEYHGESL